MPIYEFYCKKCNTVYKFYSRTIDTETVPRCPKCKRPKLERIFSAFATISNRGDEGEGGQDMPQIDESKLEKAMSMLEREADKINEDDPRQAADFMRKLTDATGINLGPGMEEALARLERGEDPEKIEEEMGDLLEDEDFSIGSKKSKSKKEEKPTVDETLYEL